MVSITVSSTERPDISYTLLLSFITQDVINLIVRFAIKCVYE